MGVPMPLFPYEPRLHQAELLLQLRQALGCESPTSAHAPLVLLSAATGSGKTALVLSAALELALLRGLRVLYLTRTKAQQQQVLKELRAIAAQHESPVAAQAALLSSLAPDDPRHASVPALASAGRGPKQIWGLTLQGRTSTCLLRFERQGWSVGDGEDLSHLCANLRARTQVGHQAEGDREVQQPAASPPRAEEEGCRFYRGLLAADIDAWRSSLATRLPTTEDLIGWCVPLGVCPHELVKRVANDCQVLVAPYLFLTHPGIRRRLLDWWGVDLGSVLVIVDEAHNLPDHLRSLGSAELTVPGLERAAVEAAALGDPQVLGSLRVSDLCAAIGQAVDETVCDFLVDEDGLVPAGAFEAAALGRLQTTSPRLGLAVKELHSLGDIVRHRQLSQGQLPRSSLGRLAGFLDDWIGLDEERQVRLVIGPTPQGLRVACLDPRPAAAVFSHCAGSVHLSGTLEPLEEYRRALGLPSHSVLLAAPTPHDPLRRPVFYTPRLTSRHASPPEEARMRTGMVEVLAALAPLNRSVAVFAMSHAAVSAVEPAIVRACPGLRLLVERPGLSQEQLMDLVEEFRHPDHGSPRPWFLGVVGGRLSEGMDFPAEQLEVVVLLGLPFPRPSAYQRAYEHYCESQFGSGWADAVETPTIRRVQQAIGRLIRSPTDRGVAIVLDYRLGRLHHGLPLLLPEADVAKRVREFFADPEWSPRQGPSLQQEERTFPIGPPPDLRPADHLLQR